MSSNNFFKSELNKIHSVIQNSMILYPKEIIISTLRDYFSDDFYYRFSKDVYGFANTTDHTDIPLGADLPMDAFGSTAESNSSLSTRLFIGEYYRRDVIFYPAIIVKSGGGRSIQISMNREQGAVQYDTIIYEDGYGNQSTVRRPVSFITAGAWEGQITIDVITRSLRSRDELIQQIAICLTEIVFDSLYDVGVTIKPLSYGSPSESDDRNDKLFRQSINLDVRTEWRREVPISNVIETILFTADIQDLSNPDSLPAPNLTINTENTLTDILLNL